MVRCVRPKNYGGSSSLHRVPATSVQFCSTNHGAARSRHGLLHSHFHLLPTPQLGATPPAASANTCSNIARRNQTSPAVSLTFLCSHANPPSSSNPTAPYKWLTRGSLRDAGSARSRFFDRTARGSWVTARFPFPCPPLLLIARCGRDGGGGAERAAPSAAGEQGSGGGWSEGGWSSAQQVGGWG